CPPQLDAVDVVAEHDAQLGGTPVRVDAANFERLEFSPNSCAQLGGTPVRVDAFKAVKDGLGAINHLGGRRLRLPGQALPCQLGCEPLLFGFQALHLGAAELE